MITNDFFHLLNHTHVSTAKYKRKRSYQFYSKLFELKCFFLRFVKYIQCNLMIMHNCTSMARRPFIEHLDVLAMVAAPQFWLVLLVFR